MADGRERRARYPPPSSSAARRVSAPINAGFFAYDIPSDQQSSADHATEVDAYDESGNVVSEQPF